MKKYNNRKYSLKDTLMANNLSYNHLDKEFYIVDIKLHIYQSNSKLMLMK
jgi:hypothetical protein